MAQTILIVEDEPRLADILEDYLRRDGYRTERAGDGLRALELWRASRPDLILLDVMLPELDGFEVARRVRADGDTPIIMLTARDDEIDKLLGLGLGADDYVVKPYSPREVMARIKAVLRRAEGRLAPPERFSVGRIEVDLAAYRASCDGVPLDLTVSELKLLAVTPTFVPSLFWAVTMVTPVAKLPRARRKARGSMSGSLSGSAIN